MKIEPPHDKNNKMSVHPTKTQISLGIHLHWAHMTVILLVLSCAGSEMLILIDLLPYWP